MFTRSRRWMFFLVLVVALSLGAFLSLRPASGAKAASTDVIAPYDTSKLPLCVVPTGPIDASKIRPPTHAQLFEPATCRAPTPKPTPILGGAALPGEVGGYNPGGDAYAWAINRLSCNYAGGCTTSSPGVNEFWYDVSLQTPSIPAGYSWSNYHFYNRMHISDPAYASGGACASYDTISAGIDYGNIDGRVESNEAIVEVQSASTGGVCEATFTGYTFSPPGAITFRVFNNAGYWEVDIWIGSWADVEFTPASWTVAPEVEFGQELAAVNGDLSTINEPVNFIHRANFVGTNNSFRPWSDQDLVSPLNGITEALPNGVPVSPLQVMDLLGGDFTSIASHNIH